MALERGARPLAQCLQCTRHTRIPASMRSLSATPSRSEEVSTETSSSAATPPPPPEAASAESSDAMNPKRLDRNLVSTSRTENRLIHIQKEYPIGSRRRRAAMQSGANIPFHQLPFQCFQEARSFLQEDRAEKVAQITDLRQKADKLNAKAVPPEMEGHKERRMLGFQKRIEELKLSADINDPLVKKTFEDGFGDMNKPIYRHLSNLEWRKYKRLVLMQRITQMNVVPDVLPAINPTVSTELYFPQNNYSGKMRVQHGDIVPSSVSSKAPTMKIQTYEKGEKMISIAVVTPDVPNVAKDAFDYRCHFLASNIPISPTSGSISFGGLSTKSQVIQPWTPPTSQKGAPYQRLAIFILEHPTADTADATAAKPVTLDVSAMRKDPRYTESENFILRSFADRHGLKPIGVDLFRTEWDEDMEKVMRRLGLPGWDVEFKRKKVEPLPYQRLKAERFR